jgi:uncharacterized membrane protein
VTDDRTPPGPPDDQPGAPASEPPDRWRRPDDLPPREWPPPSPADSGDEETTPGGLPSRPSSSSGWPGDRYEMPPPGQRVFDNFEAPSPGPGPDPERSAQLGRWAESPHPERGGAPGPGLPGTGAWDTPAPSGYEGPAAEYQRPSGGDLWGSAREPGRPPSPPGPDGDRFGPPMSAWRPEHGGRNGMGAEDHGDEPGRGPGDRPAPPPLGGSFGGPRPGDQAPPSPRERFGDPGDGPYAPRPPLGEGFQEGFQSRGPAEPPAPPLRERFGEPGRGSGVGEQPPSRGRPEPPAGRGRPEPPAWPAPSGPPAPDAWAPPSSPARPDRPDARPGFDRERATRETPGGWEPAAYRDEPPAPPRQPQQQPPPRPGVFPGGEQRGQSPQAPPGYGPIPARPGRGAPGNAMAALAYAPGLLGAMTLIIGWILRFQGMIRIGSLLIVLGIAAAVVLRARDRGNREVAFHAGQSIALDVVASASLLITLVVVPYMPLVSSLLFLVPWFGYVAAKAYLLIRAMQGMEGRLPIVGDIGDLYAPGGRDRDGGARP